MSFYLPNPDVRPTGHEAAEFVDTVPPEYPAVVDPPRSRTETPDMHGAYPRLSAEQIGALARHGKARDTSPGTVLSRAGEPECDFFVIVAGLVEVVEELDGERRVLGVHGPGRFLGELGLLTGEVMFATAIVHEAGSVVVVPADRLHAVVAGDTVLGDVILRAYLQRRSAMIEAGTGIKIVRSRF